MISIIKNLTKSLTLQPTNGRQGRPASNGTSLKYFKKISIALLLGFILIINTIPVSFAAKVRFTQYQSCSDAIIECPNYTSEAKGDGFVDCNCPDIVPGTKVSCTTEDLTKKLPADTCQAPNKQVWNVEKCAYTCSCDAPTGTPIRCGTDQTATWVPTFCRYECISNIIKADNLSGLKAVVPAYVPRVEIPCNTKIAGGECPANWKTDLGSYVGRLYQFGLMIAGIIAFAVIIYGAAQYTLSAGGFASKEDAKDIMLNAIYGLLLLFGAYLVLYTINPNLVKLGNFKIEPIDLNQFNPPEQVYIYENNNQLPESSGTAGIPGCLVAVSEAGGLLGTGFQAGLTITSDEGTQQYGTNGNTKMLCTKCDETIYTKEDGRCCLSIISNACVNCNELKASTNDQLISLFGQNQTQAIKNKCRF